MGRGHGGRGGGHTARRSDHVHPGTRCGARGRERIVGWPFLPGLDSLTVEELKSVLVSIDQPIEAVSTIDAYEWQSLDDHELERLLREWEG